jgi:phosphopentomutase
LPESAVVKRAVILVLDSFGIGAADDAERFGDAGADTLGHIAGHCARSAAAGTRARPLTLPNLARIGLMHAARESTGRYPEGCKADVEVTGAWGYAREISSGKDTPSGHWEIAGVPVLFDWGYFTDPDKAFPAALLEALVALARLPGVLGNCHASGTEIIARLG